MNRNFTYKYADLLVDDLNRESYKTVPNSRAIKMGLSNLEHKLKQNIDEINTKKEDIIDLEKSINEINEKKLNITVFEENVNEIEKNVSDLEKNKVNVYDGELEGILIEADKLESTDGFMFSKNEESGSTFVLVHIHDEGLFVGGKLHINIEEPKYTLDLDGDMRVTQDATFDKLVTAQQVTETSDERLKYDIEKMTDSVDKLKHIHGYTFRYLENGEQTDTSLKRCGVIAQEVLETVPEAVSLNDDGFLTVSSGNLIGVVINAINELDKKITTNHAELLQRIEQLEMKST